MGTIPYPKYQPKRPVVQRELFGFTWAPSLADPSFMVPWERVSKVRIISNHEVIIVEFPLDIAAVVDGHPVTHGKVVVKSSMTNVSDLFAITVAHMLHLRVPAFRVWFLRFLLLTFLQLVEYTDPEWERIGKSLTEWCYRTGNETVLSQLHAPLNRGFYILYDHIAGVTLDEGVDALRTLLPLLPPVGPYPHASIDGMLNIFR